MPSPAMKQLKPTVVSAAPGLVAVEDSEVWSQLKEALRRKYSAATDAFIHHFGGRAGVPLSLQQFEKGLKALNDSLHSSGSVMHVDVQGIMASASQVYPSGISFEEFVLTLRWDSVGPKAVSSEPQSRKVVFSTQSPNMQQKVMAGTAAHALRASRQSEVAYEQGTLTRGALSAQWRGHKGPPAHWMLKQRTKLAQQAASRNFRDNKPLLRSVKLERKMDILNEADAKLRAALDEPEPQPPSAKPGLRPPSPRHYSYRPTPDGQHKEIPLIHDFPEQAEMPVYQKVRQNPLIHEFPEQTETPIHQKVKQTDETEMKERLVKLDASVYEQRISLAETEKNILRRERAELQAQIRQIDAMQRQSYLDMQRDMKDQMSSLVSTFEKIGQNMLGASHVGQSQQGQANELGTRRNKPDRKEIARLEAEFEERMRQELIIPYGDEEGMLEIDEDPEENLHDRVDFVISRCRESDSSVDGISLSSQISSILSQAKPDAKYFLESQSIAVGDPHSSDSPFLHKVKRCLHYHPICSWYQEDADGEAEAGSIGQLSRLDPLIGEDGIDDFLLELLIAIRFHQLGRAGSRSPKSIVPILFAGKSPNQLNELMPFPVTKLQLLSVKPSIETNKLAAKLLKAIGIPTPRSFLKLSIREVVKTIIDFPSLNLSRFSNIEEAISMSVSQIVHNNKAEHIAIEAQEMEKETQEAEQASAEQEAEDQKLRELETEEAEWAETGSMDPIFLQKRDERLAMMEARKHASMRLKREADQANMRFVSMKKDCHEKFRELYFNLGLEGKSEDLATKALNARGLQLQDHVELSDFPMDESSAGGGDFMDRVAATIISDSSPRGRSSVSHTPRTPRVDDEASAEQLLKAERAKVMKNYRLLREYLLTWEENAKLPKQIFFHRRKCVLNQQNRLLETAWRAWVDQHERAADVEDGGEFDQDDPSNLEDLLQRLQAAVVETHDKHSKLLEMTKNENRLEALLMGLSTPAGDLLRQAGVTYPNLMKMATKPGNTPGFDDTQLQKLGVTEKPDLKRIETFVLEPEAWDDEPASSVHLTNGNDFDKKREQLQQEMFALREKLDLKKQRLSGDEAVEVVEVVEEDDICDTLHGVLKHLGKPEGSQAAELPPKAPVPVPDKSTKDEASPEPEAPKTVEQADPASYLEEIVQQVETLDEQTQKYMHQLAKEEDAQQEVLQYLASSLGEVRRKGPGGQEEENTDEVKPRLEAMEVTMQHCINAVQKARELLDKNASEEQKLEERPAEKAEGLAENFTLAEKEALNLAEDVKRRAQQAEALERENKRLKEELIRASQASWSGERHSRTPSQPKQHWASSLSDPELAQRYSEYEESEPVADSERFQPVEHLEDKYLEPENISHLMSLLEKPTTQHLAWDLKSTEDIPAITQAEVFDQALEDRIRHGRQIVQEEIDKTSQALYGVQGDIDNLSNKLHNLKTHQSDLLKIAAKSKTNTKKTNEENKEALVFKEKEIAEVEELLKEQIRHKARLEKDVEKRKQDFDALDWKKELEALDEHMQADLDQVKNDIQVLEEAQRVDPTDVDDAKLQELHDRLPRIESNWKLKKALRAKEIEIDVLNWKMQQDETSLQKETQLLKSAFQANADGAQDELVGNLRDMEEHVHGTARGRCREEVFKSLNGVQKIRGIIEQQRQKMESEQRSERLKQIEKLKEQRLKEEEEEQRQIRQNQLQKDRATLDMKHREARLQEFREALNKKKQEMMQQVNTLLKDAVRATHNQQSFLKQQLKMEDGTARHAKSFLNDAKSIFGELEKAVEDSGDTVMQSQMTQASSQLTDLQTKIDTAENELVRTCKEAHAASETFHKKDLNKLEEAELQKLADLQQKMKDVLPQLEQMKDMPDATAIRSRDLQHCEQRLVASWERLQPRIATALKSKLTVGDASLDTVKSAIENGKVSTALKELKKAEEAYQKFRTATEVART